MAVFSRWADYKENYRFLLYRLFDFVYSLGDVYNDILCDLMSRLSSCNESTRDSSSEIAIPDMNLPLEFDEEDVNITIPLGKSLALLSEVIFPPQIEINTSLLTRESASALELSSEQIESFLQLLDDCIGEFYVKHKGRGWKADKRTEMCDPALVYVWYEHRSEVSCFVSFRVVTELNGQCLYLYEIHVKPRLQDCKLGTKLMGCLHLLADAINFFCMVKIDRASLSTIHDTWLNKLQRDNANLQRLLQRDYYSVFGTALTVFSDNKRALDWYLGLGYELPGDLSVFRVLRKGKYIKTEYYVLFRPVDDTHYDTSPAK